MIDFGPYGKEESFVLCRKALGVTMHIGGGFQFNTFIFDYPRYLKLAFAVPF
jgi:hypothetical protein